MNPEQNDNLGKNPQSSVPSAGGVPPQPAYVNNVGNNQPPNAPQNPRVPTIPSSDQYFQPQQPLPVLQPLPDTTPIGTSSTGPDKKMKIIFILVIILILMGVGMVAYSLLKSDTPKDATSQTNAATTENSNKNVVLTDEQRAADVVRQDNLKNTQTLLEAYFNEKWAANVGEGYYPTFDELNDPVFRQNNNLSGVSFDPGDKKQKFASKPAPGVFAYSVIPSDCDNKARLCEGYSLVATLASGEKYEAPITELQE